MTAIRSWRDATPVVGHESAIIWRLFDERGIEGLSDDEAPLQGIQSLTMHRMQPGKSGDYHVHENREQVYYFTEGNAKMKIDGVVHDLQKGDAVCARPSPGTSSSTTATTGSNTS